MAGWCSDKGALVTWNLGREGVARRKPDMVIDVDVCLMSCAFHPEHPVSLLGGYFRALCQLVVVRTASWLGVNGE